MLETHVRYSGVGTERSFVELSLGIIYVSFFSARHCCRQTVSAKSLVSCYYFPPLLLVCTHIKRLYTRNYFTSPLPPPKKNVKKITENTHFIKRNSRAIQICVHNGINNCIYTIISLALGRCIIIYNIR